MKKIFILAALVASVNLSSCGSNPTDSSEVRCSQSELTTTTITTIEEPVVISTTTGSYTVTTVAAAQPEISLSAIEKTEKAETTTSQIKEFIVYKPSTYYIHKSTCHWVTSECYEISNTSNIEARLCTECNPDIKVINLYTEVQTTSAAATAPVQTEVTAAAQQFETTDLVQSTSEGYYTTINGKEVYVNPIHNSSWNSSGHITKNGGVYQGPSGKETYYNLNMSGIVSRMRRMGYDEANWSYWVREDGCKMLGDYIMVAANLNVRPRGSIVPTSLGMGIVCDTGGFARRNKYQLDIATNW